MKRVFYIVFGAIGLLLMPVILWFALMWMFVLQSTSVAIVIGIVLMIAFFAYIITTLNSYYEESSAKRR